MSKLCGAARMAQLVDSVKFGTLNVRGMSTRRKQYQIRRVLEDNELDIFAVQETKVDSKEDTDKLVQPFQANFDVCVSHASGSSGGCLLFIRRALNPNDYDITVDNVGRLIVCDFSMFEMRWRVLCVYCPNQISERKEFFDLLRPFLNCSRKLVLLGDFNCVCEPSDRSNNNIQRDASALMLKDMVDEHYIHNVATYQKKKLKQCIIRISARLATLDLTEPMWR